MIPTMSESFLFLYIQGRASTSFLVSFNKIFVRVSKASPHVSLRKKGGSYLFFFALR